MYWGEIKLRFKAISGKGDSDGGSIWRVCDRNNYYIRRANPLENNFRLYYVKDDHRKQIASARVKFPAAFGTRSRSSTKARRSSAPLTVRSC